MSNSGQEGTQKFIQHSSEGNCTCFERQERHIKLYRNAWPVKLLFRLQFRAENSNEITFFPSSLSCVALQFRRQDCSRSKVCTLKRVPALLQTAVSFHTPYSVNEKSSLLLYLSYLPRKELYLSDHEVFLTEIIICYFNNNTLQKCANGKAFYIAASPQVFATLI